MSSLGDLLGAELGPTGWLEVAQERIDAFASATDERQWNRLGYAVLIGSLQGLNAATTCPSGQVC
jgi:hypothetical protein